MFLYPLTDDYFQLNQTELHICSTALHQCVFCIVYLGDLMSFSCLHLNGSWWSKSTVPSFAPSPAQRERHSLTDYYVLCLAAQSALSSACLPWRLFCLKWSCQHDHFVSLGSLDAFARPWPAVSPGLIVCVCVCLSLKTCSLAFETLER